MTNQTSEDELKTKASDSSSEAGYTIIPELYEYCLGVGLKLSNYQAIELTKLIQRLIRTEKLIERIERMDEIKPCANGLQHCWVKLPKGKGLESHSCPSCGQLIYWSEINLKWIKPGTSGGKKIPGNSLPIKGKE